MALHFKRRALLAGAALLAAARPALAEVERAFDIAAGDGSPIRNFRIAPDLAPSNLSGVILAGPPKADLVLYEFFDYACPYCRVATQEIDVLLTPETGIKVGLVQHPVVSPRSADMARVALATARLHGDAAAYRLHAALFEAPGPASKDKALAAAARQGLDPEPLAALADGAEIGAILDAQIRRAQDLTLRSTPSFVLADFAFVGWPGPDPIDGFLRALRNCGGLRCPEPD